MQAVAMVVSGAIGAVQALSRGLECVFVNVPTL